jgi:hypothetical protein
MNSVNYKGQPALRVFAYGGRGSEARANARGVAYVTVGQGVLRHFSIFVTYSRVGHNKVAGNLLLLLR